MRKYIIKIHKKKKIKQAQHVPNKLKGGRIMNNYFPVFNALIFRNIVVILVKVESQVHACNSSTQEATAE